MSTIHLKTAAASYPIHIAEGLLSGLAGDLSSRRFAPISQIFFVTSPEIWELWSEAALRSFADSARLEVLLVPVGERHKRLSTVERLAEELARRHADRSSLLLAFGGGVIGDMTGFLAAVYMRGIRYVQIPTTLLAQVDSSVGGKTGVNLAAGKNLVGSFHQPLAVFSDIAVLRTLPAREARAGMQEAIKSGLLGDARLFSYIEDHLDQLRDTAHPDHLSTLTHVVAASVRVKARIVSADERESGQRMLLNLGHTLGHAIEAATQYRTLLHGEAVAWGMIAALHLARNRNAISVAEETRARDVIRAFGPLRPFHAQADRLVALSAGDKKRRKGVLSFVLPVKIGRAEIVQDVTEEELLTAARSTLQEMRALPKAHPDMSTPDLG